MADISVFAKEREQFEALLDRLHKEEESYFNRCYKEYAETHPNATIEEAFRAGHRFAKWHPNVDTIHIVTMMADDYVPFSKLKTETVLKALPKLFRNKPISYDN